jgi:prepilin-type N-terminal cleavage/methylation domain-containing protein
MNLKLFKLITYQNQPGEEGFSLIETMIALTTLGVCLAYAMPLFLYAKINNSKSEIRTGALIVSQRVFDNIRSKSLVATGAAAVPTTNGKTRDTNDTDWLNKSDTSWKGTGNTDGTNPVVMPADTTITAQEKLLTYAMGRQYRTKVIYCGKDATDTTVVCDTKYRKFKVEVSYNGTKVYDLEGTYTEFE